MNEASDFNFNIEMSTDLSHTVHDGTYFRLTKIKRDHRWEILKKIQDREKDNPVCIRSLQKEFEIGSQLQHQGIVHYYNYNKEGNELSREFIQGSTWLDFFNKNALERTQIKKYVTNLIEIIKFLHLNGVYHMDIKSENILITHDTKQIKLIDFGHAVYHSSTLTVGGTKFYQPNTDNGNGFHDVYAFGKLLVLTAQIPGLRNKKWLFNLAHLCMQPDAKTLNAAELNTTLEKQIQKVKRIKRFVITTSFLLLICILIYYNQRTQISTIVEKGSVPSYNFQKDSIVPESEPIKPISYDAKNELEKNVPIMKATGLQSNDSAKIKELAESFGPDFEKDYLEHSSSQSTYEIYSRVLDTYEKKWLNLSKEWKDSAFNNDAKVLFNTEMMKSLQPFRHHL